MRNRVRIPLAVLCAAVMAACGEGGTEPFQDLSRSQSRAEGFAVKGAPLVGYVAGPDGRPMKIAYEVHHGRAIWEGDIDLGPAEEIASTPERVRTDGPRLGVVRDGSKARWPGGVVQNPWPRSQRPDSTAKPAPRCGASAALASVSPRSLTNTCPLAKPSVSASALVSSIVPASAPAPNGPVPPPRVTRMLSSRSGAMALNGM